MTNMSTEIEGSIVEVVSVLRQLGTAGSPTAVEDSDRSIEEHAADVRETAPAAEAQAMAVAEEARPRAWTETLARDFLAELEPMARRVALHVWRAGAAGVHRRALCLRAELTPTELRSLVMLMGRALARFGRDRGMTLARPVAANSPRQRYLVNPDFDAVASAQVFDERTPRQSTDGEGRPPEASVVERL